MIRLLRDISLSAFVCVPLFSVLFTSVSFDPSLLSCPLLLLSPFSYDRWLFRGLRHSDSQGYVSDNFVLSLHRADAFRSYLVRRGYQDDRIQSYGLDEGHPIAENASAEGRANDRRIEIIVENELHASD